MREDFYQWNDELSDRETFFIGKIIAQWGALENEIFNQTLMSFGEVEGKDIVLPKAMNNLQFTDVLNLWKERVVDVVEKERGRVLNQQIEKILELKDYRNALVHGMLQWSIDKINSITSIRVRKKEVVSIHFTADDLHDFFRKLGSINFKVRYPGGLEELAERRAEDGSYVSRLGAAVFTGDPFADEWLKSMPTAKGGKKKIGSDS